MGRFAVSAFFIIGCLAAESFPPADVKILGDLRYGQTSDAELRLITCGGSFNAAAHSYVDNIVVYAKLAGS